MHYQEWECFQGLLLKKKLIFSSLNSIKRRYSWSLPISFHSLRKEKDLQKILHTGNYWFPNSSLCNDFLYKLGCIFAYFHREEKPRKCKNLLSTYVFGGFHRLTHPVLKIHFAKARIFESFFRTHLNGKKKKKLFLGQKPLNALFSVTPLNQYLREYNDIWITTYVQNTVRYYEEHRDKLGSYTGR